MILNIYTDKNRCSVHNKNNDNFHFLEIKKIAFYDPIHISVNYAHSSVFTLLPVVKYILYIPFNRVPAGHKSIRPLRSGTSPLHLSLIRHPPAVVCDSVFSPHLLKKKKKTEREGKVGQALTLYQQTVLSHVHVSDRDRARHGDGCWTRVKGSRALSCGV